jgi:hypothetical protein
MVVDAWTVVAHTDRALTADAAQRVSDLVTHELAAAVERLSELLGPTVEVRVEQ